MLHTRPVDLQLIQIDAFAERLFEGNPAAVMPLPAWLDDTLLQQLAAENNLSETAFYVAGLPTGIPAPPNADHAYHLRWFTPSVEVDLCGHASLATAAHLFEDVHPQASRLTFWTRSGWLRVERAGPGRLTLDLPAEQLTPVSVDPVVAAALGIDVDDVRHALRATDLVYLLGHAETIRGLTPDFAVLARVDVRGIAVTAPGDEPGIDFVSRWFGGTAGIGEDPVTGSAHSQLAPYWARRLGRDSLTARQLSARGGTVECLVTGDRVRLTGGYRRYLEGTVHLP